jgi:mono/diheme cytochrome c family protein
MAKVRWTNVMRVLFRLFIIVILLGVAAAAAVWYVTSRGFSARAAPSRLEELVAVRLRGMATPPEARDRRNPVPPTPENIQGGMAHFADHCYLCHGNDGSGRGELGPGLYPKPPDLRAERTQKLTDGELYYIIENGVRFTGMPAFGGEHDSGEDSWKLVHFIRRLPALTPQELDAMKKLNRVSADDHHMGQPAPPHKH